MVIRGEGQTHSPFTVSDKTERKRWNTMQVAFKPNMLRKEEKKENSNDNNKIIMEKTMREEKKWR